MHDLPAMYAHFYDALAATGEQCFDHDGNHFRYRNPPKLSDREVIALACTAEALECDSENLLFAKLRDYPDLLAHRGSRQRYNVRRRRLHDLIDVCLRTVSAWIDDDPREALLTDSMPIPTASVKRESRSRACRRPGLDAQLADKTYHPSSGSWVLGFKLHLITTASGVYVDHVLRPASEHDARVFAELAACADDGVLPDVIRERLAGRLVLADKGYVGDQLALDFARAFDGAAVDTPSRSNATAWRAQHPAFRRARRYVETVFAQACDEVRMKVNRAKRYSGLRARVVTKLLTRTIKQWVNYHTGKPLNQTKHWLA